MMTRVVGALILLIATSTAITAGERLTVSDFSYLGAFSIDGDLATDPEWNAYGQRGMTFDSQGDPSNRDDFPGSLWITGHDWRQWVFELSIPIPQSGISEFRKLPQPTILTPPTLFTPECSGGSEWLADVEVHDDAIWASCANWYNVSGRDLSTVLWKRDRSDLTNLQGPFHAGPMNSGRFHSNRQGMYLFSIPVDWAETHLGGKSLATGFSRNSHGGVMGPTVIAFDPENSSDAYELLSYRQNRACFKDKSQCDYPGYTACDYWGAAVWIKSGAKEALVFGGKKFDGRSDYRAGGWVCDPGFGEVAFFEPDDLAARIAGKKKPWEIKPYETWRPSELWRPGDPIGGLAYDEMGRFFYLIEKSAGPNGRAIVHVYRVRSGPSQVNSKPAGLGPSLQLGMSSTKQ